MTELAERRRKETRQAILAAAYRTFAEFGYAQATIDNIAAAAAMSKGAIYHHFTSKEELFRALLADHGHEVDAMAAAFARASSFQELIQGVVAVWIDHYRSDPLFMPLALELRVQAMRAPWAREIVADFYRQLRQLIAGLLQVGKDAGVVRRDLDVDAAATVLFGVLDGACLQAAIDPTSVDLTAVEQPVADLIERYIKAEGKGDLRRGQKSMRSLLAATTLRTRTDKE
jgi:AcrR family transcriptional regulator